jgi:acetyl-CoA acetyltransferase
MFWKAEAAYAVKSPEAESLYKDVLTTSNEVFKQKSRYGLASMCVGVGQGAAIIFEGM